MIDKDNLKLRDEMILLLGQIEAIRFPIIWQAGENSNNQAYYDLIDNIRDTYVKILNQIFGYPYD